jgi:hypothetical protein
MTAREHPVWRKADHFGWSARWECNEPECESWGGHGGDTQRENVRRTKSDARAHTEETGHSTTVHVLGRLVRP